ncbi:homocysteine S-methyltransferase family protein [Pacificispira sp.]|uniref:homocysteine S-methyltransferase family protein n=1 Tax=Pacificispira sp. TaxID=2888761 RepID=UPI003B520316
MPHIDALLNTDRPFLTDGGFETWLFFQQGHSAPEFAAMMLMEDDKAVADMRRYFDRFLGMAEAAGTGYVLDTNTWRGGLHWAEKIGRTASDMIALNRAAVRFARDMRDTWADKVTPVILNGVVGPAGDGYAPERTPTVKEAETMHGPQIAIFKEEGVDMVSAITMTNVAEAIGIANAASSLSLPVVISFTVETDGRLPTGATLKNAIAEVDAATEGAPLYYMVNCAHPEHFSDVLAGGRDWTSRIGGVRANASRLSHAELDMSEELDDGDPEEFGELHNGIAAVLPNLRVVGGCCGTDHRHVGCVSHHLHRSAA